MKPADSSLPSAAGFQPWQPPIPYLFGGLGAVMLLMAMALLVLACYYHRSFAAAETAGPPFDKPDKLREMSRLEMEPRVVVIMAGDELPTYYAKQLSPVHPPR